MTESYEKYGCDIKICQDTDAEDPRTSYDQAGTMWCEHSGYNLGDTGAREILCEAVEQHKDFKPEWLWDADDEEKIRDMEDNSVLLQTAGELGIIMLPLFLYEHGGITMSTGAFSCQWDSGQVGIIFMTPKAAEEFGGDDGAVTRCLEAEVSEYDKYLTGDVHGFVVTGPDGDEESCWGFYGEEYCREEAEGAAEYMAAAHRVKRQGKVMDMIRNRVPLAIRADTLRHFSL